MFKKSILASAIALASVNAMAGTLTITSTNVSQEGAANEASVNVPDMTLTAAAEYAVGDVIKFTISGAEFDTTASAPDLTITMTALAVGGADVVTAGLLNVTANEISYRITSQTDSGTDGISYIGATFVLADMEMKTSSVVDATGDIKVTYSAETSTGLALDAAATNTATAQTVVAQFSGAVTGADGIIDVDAGRKQFTVGPLTDTMVLTPAEAVAATHDAAYDGAVHVIKGDFSWMETDGDAGIDAAELAAAFAVTTGGDDTFVNTINADATEITVTATDGGADAVEAHTATFTVLGNGVATAPILPTQTFTVDSTVNYTPATGAAASKTVLTDKAAGEWKLNGSEDEIAIMPFGPEFAQSVTVTNTGTVEGAITVDIISGGMTYSKTLTSVAKANDVTNISFEVAAFAAEKGVTGNAAVKVVVNSPNADITVKGIYYSRNDADRVLTY